MRRLRVAAVIGTRNEELHIRRCLDRWIGAGCDVVLIDNDSHDRTVPIARHYLGRGLLGIERLPWRGCFSMKDLLVLKNRIMRELDHDWVIHADPDEWHCAPWPGMSLVDAIQRVDAAGFDCINFHEAVFVPWAHEDFTTVDYTRAMTTYYFFQPRYPHLVRAWRRDLDTDNLATGGHLLGSGTIYPIDFILRHYIALSVEHACAKYVGRPFDPSELAIGWHVNRARIQRAGLTLRPSPLLRRLQQWDSVDFDWSAPATRHFWDWGDEDRAQSF